MLVPTSSFYFTEHEKVATGVDRDCSEIPAGSRRADRPSIAQSRSVSPEESNLETGLSPGSPT